MNPKNQKRVLALAVAILAIAAFTLVTPSASSGDGREAKVKEAAAQSAKAGKVFDAIMQIPDKSIPRDQLAHAKAIAVFPQVIKASFVIGGEGGRGVVSRRTSTGWSDPVFFRAGGGSVAWQIGVSATRVFECALPKGREDPNAFHFTEHQKRRNKREWSKRHGGAPKLAGPGQRPEFVKRRTEND